MIQMFDLKFYLPFLMISTSSFVAAMEKCPQTCHCSRPETANARCTSLSKEYGSFPEGIRNLLVDGHELKEALELGDHIFANLGLKNVQVVHVTNARLSAIDKKAFQGLPLLSEVNLSNNSIETFDPDQFADNPNLKFLFLNGNPLRISADSGSFLNAPSLKGLFTANCGLETTLHITKSSFPNLDHLDLSENRLTSIPKNAFGKIENLDEVNLSGNSIKEIDPEAFIGVPDMTTLKLAGNPITDLSNITVGGLKTLDVSRCRLEHLNEAFFANLRELSHLNLSSNAISVVQPTAFSPLAKLNYIDLSQNFIKVVSPFIFQSNRRLEKISLAGNLLLKNVPYFEGDFTYLEYYDISGCGIENVTQDAFKTMKYLSSLNMSNNEIAEINSDALQGLKSIRVLDLSNNKLVYLPQEVFSENKELTKLYLRGNPLHKVPVAAFQSTSKLYHLDLSRGRISELWSSSESELIGHTSTFKELAYLNLADNEITSLNREQFESLKRLEMLDISGNPIACTDGFTELIKWLITERVVPNSVRTPHPVEVTHLALQKRSNWSTFLNQVCDEDVTTPSARLVNAEEMTPQRQTEDYFEQEEKYAQAPHNQTKEFIKTHSVQIDVKEEMTGKEGYVIGSTALVTLVLVAIVVATSNLLIFLLLRSYRRNKAMKTKPFPLDGHIQIRRGGRVQYQKLYEDCSLPIDSFQDYSNKMASNYV